MPAPLTRLALACIAATPLSLSAQDPTPTPLDQARFTELKRLLTPDPQALWRSIPWRTSLLAAQRQAATDKKLLFIWAMDGHPLGCT